MSPHLPFQGRRNSPAKVSQRALDANFDALRQDHERAMRARARIEMQREIQQQQQPSSDLPYVQELPFQYDAPPASAAPSVLQPPTNAPNISPKSTPPLNPRGSSFASNWARANAEQPLQRYEQASPADPRSFRLAPIRETPISAPLQPHLYDLRVHVEQDHQQQHQTFEFEMRFKLRLAPGFPNNSQQQR